MNVGELIEHLKTYPNDLPVCYRLCSEQILLESKDLEVENLCHPRPDGWVENRRPDKPSQQYLVFPGN
jgi:hypothetical protein